MTHNPTLPMALACCGLLLATATASAAPEESRWASCPPVVDTKAKAIPPLPPIAPGATQLSADQVFADASITRLRGNVLVQREGANLLGDYAEYDRSSGRLLLEGNVSYRGEGTQIDSDGAEFQLLENSGQFNNASFRFPGNHGFGRAEQIIVSDTEHAFLKGLSYTTCDPKDPDWELSASRLELDQATNTGEAWHARLAFMGVPFFYSPYLNFPLVGRKSGLLPPSFGSSDSGGTDISLPVYWNIAPNQDATFTPRNISKRGAMLGAEYRYLGEDSRGQLNSSYLDDDDIYGDDRSYVGLSHDLRISQGWRSIVRYRRVSDSDYFIDDLSGSGEEGSQTHLERRADLNYSDRYWYFLARVQDYQTLSGTSPYQRRPQLRLNGSTPPRDNQLRFSLESEAVSFRHEDRIPTGERVDLKPAVSLPLAGSAWFLTPRLAWRHTAYALNDYTEESYERSLPISSLDSGLFFERPLQWGDRPILQTLEPRLFYLHVPYEEQDELPLFDTGKYDFSFGQMFSDNRFSGADRQGDADQLTVALTSRLLDDRSGRELVRASIGQIQYFSDRRVTLDGSEPEVREHSDYIGELAITPSDALSMSVTEQWNPDDEEIERLSGRLHYTPGHRKVINMAYRYRREDTLHQADVALLWPLGRQWRAVARYRYDLGHEVALDTLGGLEYESCCWSLRVLARAQRDNIDDEIDNSILLTLELKGLASLGESLEESVGHGILGN